MSNRPQISVSKLRVWLNDAQKKLPTSKWSLLLLTYFSEFPYGHLEKLEDTADLYNNLITKCKFTPDESFQLLLKRLSLLKEDGWNCIHSLKDYELPQCESIPDLSSKLSKTSLLVECIVRTLVELDPIKQNKLLEFLAWEYLKKCGDHVTYLELFSELIQGKMLGVRNTQPLINGLKHVRAPPDTLCHLRDYHEQHGLGDIEYSTDAVTDAVTDTVTDAVHRTSQPLRPRSNDSNGRPLSRRGRESSVSYHSAHSEINIRDEHLPQQVVGSSGQPAPIVTPQGVLPHRSPGREEPPPESTPDSSERTNLIPPETPKRTLSKKAKCCTVTIGALVAVAILAIGSVVALSIVHQPYTKEYLVHTDNYGDDVTISLGTVTPLWYSSATIKIKELRENSRIPQSEIYAVPSFLLKQHLYDSKTITWRYNGPVQDNTRQVASAPFVYLFKGACFNYTLCLRNIDKSNATAVAFIFDNYTEFSDFKNGARGPGSSIHHYNFPIGTSNYECLSIDFVSPRDANYFVTTEVTFDNGVGRLATEGNLTAFLELFNHSNYAKACTLGEASRSCDINLLEVNSSTSNLFESYTIVAFVPGKTSEEGSTAHLSVQANKSLYVLIFPAAGLILIVSATSILGIVLYIKWKCFTNVGRVHHRH